MKEEAKLSSNPTFDLFVKAVLGKKVSEVVLLDVAELTSVADAFLICSGRSNRQVTAIADSVLRFLKKQGKKPLNIEGKKEGHWVLLDYGEVIIHIFYEPLRKFYDLEGLWIDAKRVKTESLLIYEKKESGEIIDA
jgi:ribosome-associated protein